MLTREEHVGDVFKKFMKMSNMKKVFIALHSGNIVTNEVYPRQDYC